MTRPRPDRYPREELRLLLAAIVAVARQKADAEKAGRGDQVPRTARTEEGRR